MEPALIGAALGGGSAAVMGKNPIQGALLGGLTGGVYGAAGSAANTANAAAAGESVIPYAGATSTLPAPTIAQTFKQIPNAFMESVKANPSYAMQGFGAAQSLLEPQQMPQAPMGQVHRGGQIAPVDFASALNPYQNTVIRPQPLSLLG